MPRGRKPTDAVQLKLRFSKGLHRKLVEAAAANERSLNSEIVHILTGAVVDRDVMETYRIMAQTAAEAAASRVAEKLEARMRAWQTNQESLLGKLYNDKSEDKS